MTHQSDIDIDFSDRNELLKLIKHVPARKATKAERHASGVYVQPIPYDPEHQIAALTFKEADERGYFKLDFLNVSVYQHVKSPAHLDELMAMEPPWEKLADPEFVSKVIHIANYTNEIGRMMPDTIPRMAMFLAAIRPAKKHLLGKPWKVIDKTIWNRVDGEYTFKKAHAIAYATLVVLHMNIINSTNEKDSNSNSELSI